MNSAKSECGRLIGALTGLRTTRRWLLRTRLRQSNINLSELQWNSECAETEWHRAAPLGLSAWGRLEDISHWKCVRIEALRWTTTVDLFLKCFLSGPPTFHPDNESKYTTIMVFHYKNSFSDRLTQSKSQYIYICIYIFGSRVSHLTSAELLRL